MAFINTALCFHSNVNIFVYVDKILWGYQVSLSCLFITANLQIVIFLKRADDITSLVTDTTLLVHFFGKKGRAELNFEDFYR